MRQPGFDGKYEPIKTTIENPYRKGEQEQVIVNRRESNAYTLRLGPAQQAAYDYVRRLWEQTGAWRNAAIDPSHEPVDCSSFRDPLPESVAEAFGRIRDIYLELGFDYIHIDRAVRWGLGYKEIAEIELKRPPRHVEIQEMRALVRQAFNRLAKILNYA